MSLRPEPSPACLTCRYPRMIPHEYPLVLAARQVTGANIMAAPTREVIESLASQVAADTLTADVSQVLPFHRAIEGLATLGIRGIRKRIVMITFCDSSGRTVTRRTVPADRSAAGEAGQESGGHAPGPFGILSISGVRGGQRGAGQHPGRRGRPGGRGPGWLRMAGVSGVGGDVADHRVQVPAFGVEGGVGVVFGDAPHAVPLVPDGGPARVVVQEAGEPAGVGGCGRLVMCSCLSGGAGRGEEGRGRVLARR